MSKIKIFTTIVCLAVIIATFYLVLDKKESSIIPTLENSDAEKVTLPKIKYFGKTPYIDGYQNFEQSPQAPITQKKANIALECNKKNFTMALIFVTKPISDTELSQNKNKLNYIKNRLPWAFSYATDGRATISIPNEPYILDSADLTISNYLFMPEVIKKFYESAPDNFDFVSVFSNIDTPKTDTAGTHAVVRNNIKGIGLTVKDDSEFFNSKGRLIGINDMKDLLGSEGLDNCYQKEKNNFSVIDDNSNCGMGVLLHETAHQWGIYLNQNLGITDFGSHYTYGVSAPMGTIDPLGARHWMKSEDGTVYLDSTQTFATNVYKYHPFTLYFMGVLPESEYDTKFDILQGPGTYSYKFPESIGQISSMQSVAKQLSVRDIIKVAGPRSCQ